LTVWHIGIPAVSRKNALMTRRGSQTMIANFSTFLGPSHSILYVLPHLYCIQCG